LKDQGYYNIAIHPFEPSGYKRDLVYPLLGFDEFLSRKDFANPTLIRNFISDKDSYQKIIEQYEKKGKDNPLFIFNVTMQNHGGYSSARLFEDKDNVRLTDYSGYPVAEQYLSLLRKSDQAFQSLVEYFSKQDEHTIILLFGDHQPIAYSQLHDLLSAGGTLSNTEALRRKYVVPFVLWSNYDLPKDKIDKISANYLSSYLLKTAGLKETAYNQYLNRLYEKVPVINALFYIDRDNVLHSFNETTAYSDLIKQYRMVGYNDALDHKEKQKEYFCLP
jgi:phosphoglycerol transferase MdoB-like AlkP superfamily enzyme